MTNNQTNSMISKFFKGEELFTSENTPHYDRRIVIIGSEEKVKELNDQIDWKESAIKYFTGQALTNTVHNFIKGKISVFSLKKNMPALEINSARERFDFPIQHPVNGTVYCCVDTEPDLYLPLAGFHDYFFEAKMNAFIELCSNLNAKEIKVLYAEENGKEVSGKLGVDKIPTPKGMIDGTLDVKGHSQMDNEKDIYYSFSKPTKLIKKYEKAWLNSEPSWIRLQNERINGDAERAIASFTHSDEMGINADLAAGFNNIGASIGGSYTELTKRKFQFSVEFWPKE